LPADLPDYAGARHLHERRVERIGEFRRRIALPEVAPRAVIHQIERAIRAEHRRHRSVDAAQMAAEGLVRDRLASCSAVRAVSLIGLRAVESEPGLLHRVALAERAEVDQLDIVPCGRLAIFFRKSEVSLAGYEHRAARHDAVDEGIRREVEPDGGRDRKSTRLNSSHVSISYAVFCLKKKKRKVKN